MPDPMDVNQANAIDTDDPDEFPEFYPQDDDPCDDCHLIGTHDLEVEH